MLEQNKKEVASRHEAGTMQTMLNGFEKHPDVAKASHVGEPTMVDPEPVTATGVVKDLASAMGKPGGDSKLVGVQTINGNPAPNQPAPRSDTPVAAADSAATTTEQPAAAAPAATADLKATASDPNELKPNVEPDPNALPPLQQNNELESNGGTSSSASSAAAAKPTEEMADISSSRKKKKKGLAKLNPF
jgi:outer membrane protein assembly factor BamD